MHPRSAWWSLVIVLLFKINVWNSWLLLLLDGLGVIVLSFDKFWKIHLFFSPIGDRDLSPDFRIRINKHSILICPLPLSSILPLFRHNIFALSEPLGPSASSQVASLPSEMPWRPSAVSPLTTWFSGPWPSPLLGPSAFSQVECYPRCHDDHQQYHH